MRLGRPIPALPAVAAAAMALLAAALVPLLPADAQGNATSCSNGTVVPNPASNPGLVSDCEVLLSVRDTLAGTGSLNWSATTPIDQWDGITVGGAPQRVMELSLPRRQLAGEIPPELGRLAELSVLDFDGNQLTGQIPPELARLPKLRRLLLRDNLLTGEIPSSLGRLADLSLLGLRGNQLTGQIPPELARLSKLTWLLLHDNQLTGEIPPDLGRLASLQLLDLGGNRLTGQIPPELGNLSQLSVLSLHSNQLTGAIPAELGTLPNLYSVYLSGNNLTGCIPEELRSVDSTEVGRLGLPFCDLLLNGLVVSHGSLAPPFDRYRTDYIAEVTSSTVTVLAVTIGDATAQILEVDGREVVDADIAMPGTQIEVGAGTEITIRVVSVDGEASHTYTIGIRRVLGAPTVAAVEAGGGYLAVSWSASDEFAEARTASYDLRYIPTAADESVDGNWTVVTNVPSGSADGNPRYNITGLSPGTQYEVQVRAVDRDGEPAAWSASVTGTPTTPSACVTDGAVTGAINPDTVSDCESLLAARDVLAGSGRLNWSASTPIKDWDGVTLGGTPPRVVGLSVNSRGLDGTIPTELGDLAGLQRLLLFENRLTGRIPAELGMLAELRSLDLSDNRLSGSIPSRLGVLDNLVAVDLSGNDLRGCTPPVPDQRGALSCFADEGMTLIVDSSYLLLDDQLRIASVVDASNGVVTLDGTTITYRHDGSETTAGGFTYTVSDGADSTSVRVDVTVSPVNDPPTGEPDELAVREGGSVSVDAQELLANDADAEGGTLSITAVGDATNGEVTLDGNTITYRHDGAETTAGSFTYTVSDGTDSAIVLVAVTVSPVNDPPVGVDDALRVDEGGSVSVQALQLLANDTDPDLDTLSITAVGDAANGLVTLDGNTVYYRHDGSETTSGSFTYTVYDGAESATASVTIAVSPVNDPPVGLDDTLDVEEGGSVAVQTQALTANDTDAEGDSLSITAVGGATNGLVTLDGNTIDYVHDGSETTSGSFTYTITDGADSTIVLVAVTVSPVNDPPVAVDDNLIVDEGSSLSVQARELLANDSDAEGDTLGITAVGDAISGLVTLDGNTITYAHGGSETTSGSFTYTVSDGTDSTTALVTVAVSPVNDRPIGGNDAQVVDEGGTVAVQTRQLLANDADADGDALRITAVGGAVNGVVTLDGNTVTYEHDGSETTSGSFTYTVSDRTDSATVLVSITVNPVDDVPVLLIVSVALGAALLAVGVLAGFAVGRKRRAS